MIEFKRDLQGEIRFCPDALVLESLSKKLAEAEQVLLLASDKGGLRFPASVAILARHPYAQLLAAYRIGLASACDLGDSPLALTRLSATDIAQLSAGQLLLAPDISLLPARETRGKSFALAPMGALDRKRFRANMAKLSTMLGASWANFIGILRTITFVDVAGMPGLPYFSGSSNITFGAMHMIYSDNSHILAECITHEAAHTWLALVDSQDRLARDMWNEARTWISPWREDARPIGGIVHGVFVFSCVLVVLLKILEQAEDLAGEAGVRKRLARIASQVEDGIEVLRGSGLLTEAGEQLCVDSEARLRDTVPALGKEWAEARLTARVAHKRKQTSLRAAE